MSQEVKTTGRSHIHPRCFWRGAFLAVVVLAFTGCSKKPDRQTPQTFPVTGQVISHDDRLPVGGCVEFKPGQNEFEFTAMGVIDAEGNFSLRIPYVDRVLSGATEGPHSVRVMLPIGKSGGGGGVVPIEGSFTVQPRENYFTINMPKKRLE
jgi:hypothetical protein